MNNQQYYFNSDIDRTANFLEEICYNCREGLQGDCEACVFNSCCYGEITFKDWLVKEKN